MPLVPISSICTLFEEMAGDALAHAVGESVCVFRVRGYIGDWTQRNTFWNGIYHGIDFFDETGKVIGIDISFETIQSADIHPHALIEVIASPSVYLKKSIIILKLHVHAANVLEQTVTSASESVRNIAGAVSHLRSLGFKRIPFPRRLDTLSVIHSRSQQANVLADFLNELGSRTYPIEDIPVAMTDPSAIAQAVTTAKGNVLVLVRGGGDDGDFAVFQDDRVVSALARKNAHRVTGLGHSGNLTCADVVADFCTSTPASAGGYVREQVARTYNARQEENLKSEEKDSAIRKLRTLAFRLCFCIAALMILAGWSLWQIITR